MDDCPITMPELATVKAAYVDLLRGAFHPRVQYPTQALPKVAGVPTIAGTGASVTPVPDQAEETEEIVRSGEDGDQGRVPDDGADAGSEATVVELPTEPHEPVTAAE